jgi:hypothetical protein
MRDPARIRPNIDEQKQRPPRDPVLLGDGLRRGLPPRPVPRSDAASAATQPPMHAFFVTITTTGRTALCLVTRD